MRRRAAAKDAREQPSLPLTDGAVTLVRAPPLGCNPEGWSCWREYRSASFAGHVARARRVSERARSGAIVAATSARS
jgi:hypothetical protein